MQECKVILLEFTDSDWQSDGLPEAIDLLMSIGFFFRDRKKEGTMPNTSDWSSKASLAARLLVLALLFGSIGGSHAWLDGATEDADGNSASTYRGTLASVDILQQTGGSTTYFEPAEQMLDASEMRVVVGASGSDSSENFGEPQPTLQQLPEVAFEATSSGRSTASQCPGGSEWIAVGLALARSGHYPAISSIVMKAPTTDGWSASDPGAEGINVEVYTGMSFLGENRRGGGIPGKLSITSDRRPKNSVVGTTHLFVKVGRLACCQSHTCPIVLPEFRMTLNTLGAFNQVIQGHKRWNRCNWDAFWSWGLYSCLVEITRHQFIFLELGL